MSDRLYDQFGHRFLVTVGLAGNVAIDGTASALAAVANSKVQLPFACKLVAGSRLMATGATAAEAGVSCIIVRSIGGTGTVFAVGTYAFNGTLATGAVGTAATLATGTAVEFAAGDVIAVSENIATAACPSTHVFVFAFEELYN